MNLSAATFLLLLPPSAYADLPSPIHFRHHFEKNSVPSPTSNQKLFQSIGGGIRRGRDLETSCSDFRSNDEFFRAIDNLWNSKHVVGLCNPDRCDWDFTTALATGEFREASHICRENGGVMYAYDAHIVCGEDSHEHLWHPFYCIAVDDCSAKILEETMLTEAPANLFIENGDDLECSWQSLTVHTLGDESPHVCADASNEEYYVALDHPLQDYYEEENPECSTHTMCMDLSEFVSDGSFDEARSICNDEGGAMYTFDGEISCSNEKSFLFHMSHLGCYSTCSEHALETYTPIGIPASVYVGINDGSECSWDSFKVYEVRGEAQGNGGNTGDGGASPKSPKMMKQAKSAKIAKTAKETKSKAPKNSKAKSSKCTKTRKSSKNIRSLEDNSASNHIPNGEEACQNRGLNKDECLAIGCCHWNDWEFDGLCFSSIGQDVYYEYMDDDDDDDDSCDESSSSSSSDSSD